MVLLDDSVRFVGFTAYVDSMPPTLYKSDSYTVLREVTDLRTLRAGDRCVVGEGGGARRDDQRDDSQV